MSSAILLLMIGPIGGIFMTVATETPSSTQPDLIGLAALITAGVGVLTFLATYVRGKQNNKRIEEAEEAASYIKGFDALIKRLESEINALRNEHDEEKEKWAIERTHLQATIENLQRELKNAIANNYETRGLLAELRGQIKGFLTTQQYEEFLAHVKPHL